MRPETRLSYVAVASSAGRLELWRLNQPDNPSIAEAVLINPNEPLPLSDGQWLQVARDPTEHLDSLYPPRTKGVVGEFMCTQSAKSRGDRQASPATG